jgi:hypothetical protein
MKRFRQRMISLRYARLSTASPHRPWFARANVGNHDDAMKRGIGLAVAPAIEAMRVGLARTGGKGLMPQREANAASERRRSG